MAELFRAFLLTSAVGTALAIILTLLKPITRKHFSGGWHYYIWLVVLLVMIFPIKLNLPEKPITTQNTKTINTTLKEETQTPLTETPITVQEETQPITIQTTQPEKISFMQQIKNFISNNAVLISCIWLSGALLLLLLRLLNYMIFLIRVHRYTEIISCPEVAQYTKRKIKTRTSEKISSPLIIGVFRPTLLLPETALTPEQLHNILSHEMTHLNRNDLLYKWFVGFVKCLCWYNPMIYFISRQINIDCEISCDLSVVEKMNNEEKKSYIETILSLLSHNKSRAVPLTTGMAGDKKILKRRFTMIKNKKNISKRNKILSTILAVVLLITTLLTSGVLATSLTDTEDSKIKILYNNNIVELTNEPFIENGTIYVPFRELFEKTKLSDYIKWDNGRIEFCLIEYDNIPIYNENGKIEKNDIQGLQYFYGIEIGKKEYTLNPEGTLPENRKHLSTKKSMENAPMLKDSITYIPYEYIEDFVNQNMTNKNTIKVEYMSTKIAWPIIDGTISRDFGTAINPATKIETYHNGLDITAPEGTSILSAIKGKVIEVGFDNEMGNYVIVADNDISVMYGHMAEVYVSKDNYVEQKSIIGTVGKSGMATGSFLHFEIRINGDCLNPIMFCNPIESVSIVGSSVFNVDNNNIEPIEIIEDNTKPHSVVDSFFRRFETKDYSGMKTFCKNSLWDMHYKESQGFGGFELARLDELLEPIYIKNDNYILYEVKILGKKTTDTDYYKEIKTWKVYVEKQSNGTYLIADIEL